MTRDNKRHPPPMRNEEPLLVQQAKKYLQILSASPRKKLGQNFMIHESDLSFIADALSCDAGEQVLEIGPGLGFLTRFLLQKRLKVTAVEKDKSYAKFLRDYFSQTSFKVFEKDILKVNLKTDLTLAGPVRLYGNIPYSITTPILEWMIGQRNQIREAVLTTQLEVADRLTAVPGAKAWGSLSIFLQVVADVQKIRKIEASSFYPAPKVDSAVIKISFLDKLRYVIGNEAKFFSLVRRAFQKRRKTLLNALKDEREARYSKSNLLRAFKRSKIDPIRRAETLSIKEWAELDGLIG